MVKQHPFRKSGPARLGKGDISRSLKGLKLPWDVMSESRIQREFIFPDFRKAIAFVKQVAKIAERDDHHPDIIISYRTVTVILHTHSIGGLSAKDFALAAKIEKLI